MFCSNNALLSHKCIHSHKHHYNQKSELCCAQLFSCVQLFACLTICNPIDCNLAGSSVHGDFPGKNVGAGCHAVLQGIFPTQGSNPSLPHCRQILYKLSHQGSPRKLEWVAYPFSRGSFQPRNQTRIPDLQVDSLPAELPGKPIRKSVVDLKVSFTVHLIKMIHTILKYFNLKNTCAFTCQYIYREANGAFSLNLKFYIISLT